MQPRHIVRLALLVALVACTIALAVGRDDKGESLALPHGDATYYYVYMPSLWLDGDVDFENQYRITGDPWQQRPTVTGRAGNVFGIGPAVFASPLFLLGHGVASIGTGRSDGFSTLAFALAAWASVLASLGAVWFAYRLLARRLADERGALAAALLVFAAGPVLFYAVRQPGMAHPFATLFAAWLLDEWDRSYDEPRTLRTWAVLGALFGCMVLARPQLVTWGVCLAIAAVTDLRHGWRTSTLPRVARNLGVGVVASIACVLPQLITWKVNYGSWLVVPQGDGFMRWDAPAWSETLFSSRNGLLPWSPLYAIALVGLFAAVRRLPRLAGVMLVGIVAQAIVNGAAWDWWAGGSFGARRFDSTYIAFALGLGFVLLAARRHRAVLWVCAAACGWLALANVILTLQTTPYSMRQKGGEAASKIIDDQLGGFGTPVGWLSSLTNLPARAAFAIKHDTDLGTYDRVVGVHWLAETYPELSTKVPRVVARRNVADIPAVFRPGGRVLIGLNRRGPVHVEVGVSASAPFAIHWNGEVVASQLPGEQTVTFDVASPVRGTNTLGVRGSPDARILWVELRTDDH